MIGAALAFAALAFTLSASAGLGGSLILVPGLVLLLGAKKGVALAALLLAGNNIAKVIAYRTVIPLRAAAAVLALTVAGAVLGAGLLVAAADSLVSVAVVVSIATTLLTERIGLRGVRRAAAPLLAFFSGVTSGFTGTSGPLKGIALRNLDLDRQFFVGAASAVSLAGDAAKVGVYSQAAFFDGTSILVLASAVPIMCIAVLIGRRINSEIGERGYAALFWTVMAGYSLRLLL